MSTFEVEVQKREKLYPLFSYPYQVIPLTDQAKIAFALFKKDRGPIEGNYANLIKKYLKADKVPFKGQATFCYEDPKETEENLISSVKELANFNMAERSVPGISSPLSGKRTYYVALTEGEDYKIEVGEKIVHEQPKILSFDDIKAL
jgi:hypothetical protein